MFYKISILPSLVDTVVKEIGIKSETAKLIFGTDGRKKTSSVWRGDALR